MEAVLLIALISSRWNCCLQGPAFSSIGPAYREVLSKSLFCWVEIIWYEPFTFSISPHNVFMTFFLDQYVSTKESWLADYCKEDKETESAKSEDWMGSSVDPPCFGQSKVFYMHMSVCSSVNLQSSPSLRDSIGMVSLCGELHRKFNGPLLFLLVSGKDSFLAQTTELLMQALILPMWGREDLQTFTLDFQWHRRRTRAPRACQDTLLVALFSVGQTQLVFQSTGFLITGL